MPGKYRFRHAVDEVETYPDGTEVPHRFSMIEREQPDGTWEVVGYAEVQLHKVRRDESGVEDISIGFHGLVNPEPDNGRDARLRGEGRLVIPQA